VAKMMKIFLVLCFFGLSFCQDPSYDHQTTTYTATFIPFNLSNTVTLTPYFSPYTPVPVQTELIENAMKSVDVGIPSFSSWSGCYCGEGVGSSCTVSKLYRNESFPIFAALLNAVHRGVTVRILTNYYPPPCDSGIIDPLTFLSLAGAQVRYFTTTTFIHSKYIAADGKKAAVSSVNFSYTSFMENREAGILIEGSNATPILKFLTSVFDADFKQGGAWPAPTYSDSDMAIINNQAMMSIPVTVPRKYSMYQPSLQPVTANLEIESIASPDYAYDAILTAVNQTTKSFEIYIYQITDDDFCNAILNLYNSVSTFKLLVSREIYDAADRKAATACYTTLYNAGVPIYQTNKTFKYCHQKFWIIDGTTVFMSTGNWGYTDYPPGSNDFPPYGNSGWRKVNRDFTLRVKNKSIVDQFKKVLDEDYSKGSAWVPS
jgi:phosphatidylserine/phosphatidylglycerophosphate/cardiolipin synthase-like enzyme